MAAPKRSRRPGVGRGSGIDRRRNGMRGNEAPDAPAMAKKKKSRTPKAFLAPQDRDIDEDMLQDADDMLDTGDPESKDDDKVESTSPATNGDSSRRIKAGPSFLLNLDEKQVSRTNAETKRIRQQELARERAQNGDERKRKRKAKEASPDSDGESTDMEGASIASSDDDSELDDGIAEGSISEAGSQGLDEEEEDAYAARIQRATRRRDHEEERERLAQKRKRLPVRGQASGWDSVEPSGDEEDQSVNGVEDDDSDRKIYAVDNRSRQTNGTRASRSVHAPADLSTEEGSEDENAAKTVAAPRSTILTGSRFGMQSPYGIMSRKKRAERIQLAREQIARLSTEIVNDPELTLGLVRRLAVFAGQRVTSPEDDTKHADVDDAIRAFAILSMCAVFTDVLPGYRIRDLSEAEQKERVNQDLARRREWEQGLVVVYRNYLELCERVARRNTPLFSVAVKAMCTLAVKATHFNFRTNLIRSLVSCLSRKKWDAAAQDCSQALTDVLKSDRQGDVSLEIVRLLNRMIKERKFRVHAGVLDILLHLRLRDELSQGKRADTTSAAATAGNKNDMFDKKLKSRDIRKGKGEHLSKKGVKRAKELREIQDEMKEAEAEVNHEERERHQTETLKLLFVLYFSIVKAPTASDELLIATLRGLRLFAHRINIEFFRDLLSVLRVHVRVALDQADEADGQTVRQPTAKSKDSEESKAETEGENGVISTYNPALALHCIVTSLELLHGQGEALNLDLGDIIAQLFSVMVPLCNYPALEDAHGTHVQSSDAISVARLLFRALHLALVVPQRNSLPAERLAAFVSRMSICAMHMPAKTSIALLDMIQVLVKRNDALKTMLDNGDDRARNGHFDPASNNVDGLRPLQAGFVLWPLSLLAKHAHSDVLTQSRSMSSISAG